MRYTGQNLCVLPSFLFLFLCFVSCVCLQLTSRVLFCYTLCLESSLIFFCLTTRDYQSLIFLLLLTISLSNRERRVCHFKPRRAPVFFLNFPSGTSPNRKTKNPPGLAGWLAVVRPSVLSCVRKTRPSDLSTILHWLYFNRRKHQLKKKVIYRERWIKEDRHWHKIYTSIFNRYIEYIEFLSSYLHHSPFGRASRRKEKDNK